MIIKNRCQCALSNYNLGKSTRERKFKHKMIFFPVLKPLECMIKSITVEIITLFIDGL